MPKLKLLILDANVVIYLQEKSLWRPLLERCEVYLSRLVAEHEVRYYHGTEWNEIIDLTPDIQARLVQVFDVPVASVRRFRAQFDLPYLGDLDDGEAESLAFLFEATDPYLISSGDAIVYRILGNLNRADAGLSLEEILQRIGLTRTDLARQYRREFREAHTKTGQQDAIQGCGHRQGK
ncbi:MAG: hypothetical protein ABR915_05935 [Thermoguttaceae bacterium]|jgi:hypothetical protein